MLFTSKLKLLEEQYTNDSNEQMLPQSFSTRFIAAYIIILQSTLTTRLSQTLKKGIIIEYVLCCDSMCQWFPLRLRKKELLEKFLYVKSSREIMKYCYYPFPALCLCLLYTSVNLKMLTQVVF